MYFFFTDARHFAPRLYKTKKSAPAAAGTPFNQPNQ